jgi:two-component system, chemotaxis family, CheB/CheR fusion protein
MHNRPIDDFFKSLAEEQRERAIAVILSGMGSNGTAGAQAIKAVGGLCIAQDPESASFPSMPHHLIDAGYADYILRPRDMPEMLLAYAGHAYARDDAGTTETALQRDQHIREILAVLRTRTRHDFSGYKKPTLLRRIQRRMGLARVTKLGDYARLLRQTPAEVTNLADDLLIHVTGFFRDPDAWEILRQRVIVPLVASRAPDSSIRAWVAACSSGEEAYTLAMLLVEEAERVGKQLDIKVFATDTAERTLQNARHGVYPGGIEAEIVPERLERFFQKEDAVYRVRHELRERVVFAPQNVLQDPPFSRLDIASCRNLLIYLEPDLQQRVLSLLHFGLREGGTLFLGTSETTGGGEELFESIDKKARIFRRVGPTRHGAVDFPLPRVHATPIDTAFPDTRGLLPRPSIGQLTTRSLLEHHTPAAVAVDRDYRVVYYHGHTAPFLSQPSGEPTRELLTMARDTLRGSVRTAMQRAMARNAVASVYEGWIETDGRREHVTVTASPLNAKSEPDYFVVSFRIGGPWAPRADDGSAGERSPESNEDLRRVRDELQSTVEELQTSNEELKAAHEEVVSTNEELQSTNEELETSREEMQSLNKELSTVNSQLQAKMEENQAVTNDLASLLTSTDIAVLFLDTRFRIRRFTPQVKDLLDVIATDVGRPLSDLARKFEDPDLLKEAATVLERLVPSEREIQVEGGRFFVRRLTPYRTTDNRIDGVVVTFMETTARYRAEEAVRKSEEQFRRAIEEAPFPIIMQAESGEVLQINRAWTSLTGYTIEDMPVLDSWLGVLKGESGPEVRRRLHEVFRGEADKLDTEFVLRTRSGDERLWQLIASAPAALADGRLYVVGMAVDLTERQRAEETLESSRQALETAGHLKDLFIANISHELRTPLSVILMWSKLLAKVDLSKAEQNEAAGAIIRSAEAQSRLIDDLLDVTRIASGKLRVNLKPTDFATLVRNAVAAVQPLAAAKGIGLEVAMDGAIPTVTADAGRLEQVLWILLTNAVKFTPSGGSIRVEVRMAASGITCAVSDTGAGIPPEFFPKLFRPFFQADGGGQSKSGLGLGLSIARSLMELHGGTISATSRGVGQGSTFTMVFPQRETAEAPSDTGEAAGETLSLRGARIMVVEDNPDALRAIQVALEAAQATVFAFGSGSTAIAAFEGTAPQVVVSDLGMPGMDGFEVMHRIREIEARKGLEPIASIAVTARATKSDRDAALGHGFDDFVAKPVNPETLVAAVAALIAR